MLVAVSIAGTAACASENESPCREFETAYNAEVSGTTPGQSGDAFATRLSYLSRSVSIAAKDAMGETKSLLSEIFLQEMKYDRALREGAGTSTTNAIKDQFRGAVTDLGQACESEGHPLRLTADWSS